MRNARNEGGLEAFEKLVILDKNIIFDKAISEKIAKWGSHEDKSMFIRYTKAMAKPFPKMKARSAKISIAALVSKLFQAGGVLVTLREIQNLFDLTWRMRHGTGDACDPDLPDDPETFAREVRRHRAFWSCIPDPPEAGQK